MLSYKSQYKHQIYKMGWKCNWTRFASNFLSLFLYVSLIILPPINASNNACDWTGSGLSTQHEAREIVSIDLRCSAGKIVWNYPRGAIRILLRSNIRSTIDAQKSFRVCLKVHQSHSSYLLHKDNDGIKNQTNKANSDLNQSNKIARIFLEAPKRLIALYDDVNDKQMVKCFRSIGGQVALYVEADKTPFEIMQTIFEYNLEFINNKQHSIPTQLSRNDKTSNDGDSLKIDSEKNESDTWWWWSRWLNYGSTSSDDKKTSDATVKSVNVRNRGGAYVDEEIVGGFGESWDICRPCSEEEMIHAYCSSDIVTRGTIYSIQQQPSLDTVEVAVKRTKILRNNMQAILNAEDTWRRHYKTKKFKTKKHRRKSLATNSVNDNEVLIDLDEIKFHTPTHCSPYQGEGEFVFIGRRRFDELMLICAPRLEEWAHISRKFNETNTAPCILLS